MRFYDEITDEDEGYVAGRTDRVVPYKPSRWHDPQVDDYGCPEDVESENDAGRE